MGAIITKFLLFFIFFTNSLQALPLLQDRVAVITGAASGIGRAIAKSFHDNGAKVCLIDKDRKSLDLVCDAFGAVGYCIDLTDTKSCSDTVKAIEQKFARIDILVNNAGVNDCVGLSDTTADFKGSLEKNLIHYFTMLSLCHPFLKESKGCCINISSKVAFRGEGNTIGYACAKGAILSMTREAALMLAPYLVRVNAIIPAEVRTSGYETWLKTLKNGDEVKRALQDSIPLGKRLTEPYEIANTALFLASDLSSHMTGQFLFMDGGKSHLEAALHFNE